MNKKLTGLAQRYAASLRKYLKSGLRTDSQPALKLGREAVSLKLDTLGLARIHEQAFATLKLSNCKNRVIKRAETFFSNTIIPVEETHRASRQNKSDLNRLNETLKRRTAELVATTRQLKCDVVRRKNVEEALKKSGEHYAELLKESMQLQKGLRQLAHRVLGVQEDERKNISQKLQNEIAQSLLGINIRLLSLKQEARSKAIELKNQIASTQRLMVKSARSVRKVTRGFRYE